VAAFAREHAQAVRAPRRRQIDFQQVLQRISAPDLFARPIVITNADFRFVVAEQLRESGIEADIVLEPARRDSGPAVAVATALATARDPQSILLVLAADHVIGKPEHFRTICRAAAATAQEGMIVTFGIRPTHPATNYGYIRPGQPLNGGATFAVDAFVEKPDAVTAASYVANNYLWNSGNFLFRADVMRKEITHFEPAMAKAAETAVAGQTNDLDFIRLAVEPFTRTPRKSIDYAVMERTKLAAVMPADLGWTDLGSWSAVWDMLDHDADGNAIDGPVVAIDSRNILVHSDESVLTTVLGVNDLVVVSTADAVLVAARDKAEDVKALVARLKNQNRREAIEHRRIYRPWGYYQCIDTGGRYQAYRGQSRRETIVAKTFPSRRALGRGQRHGRGNGKRRRPLDSQKRIDLCPIGSAHRLANPGKIPLELIEVQVGSYLGEDDIVRLDDAYDRK
jgi:mannose-1-phosphate guanylyltransferase/mannose-6-phosphate isomerase